ncbi:MAG: tetratricopeptide repeat protein [Chitinophagaceae bacterium]
MKKIFFLFLLITQNGVGQTNALDSLTKVFDLEKITEKKLELLNQMIGVSSRTDLNLGLVYARQAVAFADKVKDKSWQPKFYEAQGRMHANLLELDSASFYLAKAMEGYALVDNKKGKASTWFKIGWVHKKRGDTDKAMDADLNALKLMEAIDDKLGIAGAYSRLSEDLYQQGKYEGALDYANKTIAVCEKYALKEELVYGYTAAGSANIALHKHSAALDYFDKALSLAKSFGFDGIYLSDFTNNKGNALKRLGRYKDALAAYQEAFKLAKQSNYANAIAGVTANLGEVNLIMKNYEEALKYQLEAAQLQEKSGDLTNLTESYEHISTTYEKLNNFPLALDFQKKARKMRDSVASIESDRAMSAMLTKYETQKKDATILLQQKQISQQKIIQWLSAGLVVLLAGFLFFGYRSNRARARVNKLLLAKNAENELLLKEIHHRVKNNLEVVSSLLALQSSQIDDPNTKDAMLEGQNRVQSIGIVHQKLYQGSNLGAIEMKDYFINLSESILDSFGAEKRVSIDCAMDALDVDIDTAVPLGLIVNELLTNTLKYAFPEGQLGKVRIKLEKQKDGVLLLEVSDNGVGKSSVTKGTGFGGQLVALLTQQLSGTIREEVKNGTSVYFVFKPAKAA